MDIVTRLRFHEQDYAGSGGIGTLHDDLITDITNARKEIERLRAALEEINAYMEHRYQDRQVAEARRKIKAITSKALKQSENE